MFYRKYLRDPEREELSNEALLLCLQALRKKMSDAKTVEEEKAAVIDVFKIYKRCVKQWEANKGQFATLLTDAYAQYKKEVGFKLTKAFKSLLYTLWVRSY